MKLKEDQQNAIGHAKGHLQLIACAGSGKPEVVAQRVATLLTPRGTDPCRARSIIAFTFTEKAAAELKERIIARCRAMHGDILDTFPIVRKNDEKAHGEYRTKRLILEVYDALAEATRTGRPYATRLDPPPADPRVAHPDTRAATP
jgi:superfamily I DNA/RNA helicase